MASIKINSISLEEAGHKIKYDYDIPKELKKYFKDDFFARYDVSVADVPESILVIPFVANLLPISWMLGFDIVVNEIDDKFHAGMQHVKAIFAKEFPQISQQKSEIVAERLVTNQSEHKTDAMLFSGGVDAYATYFRNFHKPLDLVLVRGADIPLDDHKQWQTALDSMESEQILDKNPKHYIEMNCRNFYSYHVTELVAGGGWWGKVQHGLSLTCSAAPLAYVLGYGNLSIAATHNVNFRMFWGSMPEIDQNTRWADTLVHHDGFDLTRIDKVELIVKNAQQLPHNLNLRVCYSEFNHGLNCSECEKCYRTMLAITVFGANPNDYGFKVGPKLYDDVEKIVQDGFATKGIRYDWEKTYHKLQLQGDIYQFDGHPHSKQQLEQKLAQGLALEIVQRTSFTDKFKRKIIGTFPNAFKVYLKIRGSMR